MENLHRLRWCVGAPFRLVVLLALLLPYSLSVGTPAPQLLGDFTRLRSAGAAELAAPAVPRYQIVADLDFDAATLAASQTVTYINTTSVTLSSIVFNVTPNYYRSFALERVTVGGQPVAPALDGVVLEIPLPAPLPPQAQATIAIDYRLRVPSPGNLRFGKASGILALGNWYPVLAVYQHAQADWNRHRYVDTGDAFFTEAADYEVTLNLSRPLTIAHSGEVVSGADRRLVLRARGVRDFALALSDRYRTRSVQVDETTITVFYLPEHSAGGAQYLQSAEESLRWLNRQLGPYPYPSLHIAETISNDANWVGQEYPNLVFISSQTTAAGGGIGSYLSYLVIHEIVHQWFYGLVGGDQLYEPWLDEAPATYLAYQFFRANYPGLYDGMWRSLTGGYRSAVNSWGDRTLDTSIYDYGVESHYFAIIYRKGAMFLDELREAMGADIFYPFLREFVETYRARVATGYDFLDLAQTRSSADLRPLFGKYFSYPRYAGTLDYDIPNGHFFTQTNGQPPGASSKGFGIVDDANAPLWSEFRRLGGVAALGYPVSRRFAWDGFVSQAVQKGILQWQPSQRSVLLVNIFDELSRRGLDGWLASFRQVPQSFDWRSDAGKPWADVVASHLAVLDSNPGIKAQFNSVPNPVNVYGLPMAYADMGNNYTLRAQRVVIQQWKQETPWAQAGQVTVANGGDIGKEAGLIPAEALVVMDPREAIAPATQGRR
ncbi:MAG: M1 family metallopeptidase [Chloroflexi bacterium]|nr:M1 family metallopeptidase [Chloroflexota bacterium]